MSEIYVNEPPTFGRIVIHTNRGDLVVELWSRECPKTCRVFIQACLDGLYNNILFHRVIPGFVIQTGAGASTTPDLVFPTDASPEIHSRLKYRYRGILGVANTRSQSPNREFFITLDKAESLNGRNTIFGRIVGDSLYNLNRLLPNDGGAVRYELDANDRPIVASGGDVNVLPQIVSVDVIEIGRAHV